MDAAGDESFNDESGQQSEPVDNDLIAIGDAKDDDSGPLNVAAASVGELSTKKRGGLISRLFGGGRKADAELAQTQQLLPDTAVINAVDSSVDSAADNAADELGSESGSDVPISDAEPEDAQDDDMVVMTSTNQTEQQISSEGVIHDADIEPVAKDVEQPMGSASNDGGAESLSPPSAETDDSSGSELSATIENQQGVGVGDSGSDKVISSKVKTYKPGTFDYQGDVVSGVRVSDRDEIADRNIVEEMSDSSEFSGQSGELSALESDDFDVGFSETEGESEDDHPEVAEVVPVAEPIFDQSPKIADAAPAPMVNPEELGLLKLFDDPEEPADAAARVVEEETPVTDLKDELLGFEKFLEIQSTLVNQADGDDKSSLGLYNIDSSDVKFAIVSAYVEDGNVDGARDMLLEIVEQVDGAELERARALLDTL